jgi:hypothetical protein
MPDITISLNVPVSLATHQASDIAAELRGLGYEVAGPPPAVETRSIDPTLGLAAVTLTLAMTAKTMRDIDTIVTLARKWISQAQEGAKPRNVEIYEPDGEKREIRGPQTDSFDLRATRGAGPRDG